MYFSTSVSFPFVRQRREDTGRDDTGTRRHGDTATGTNQSLPASPRRFLSPCLLSSPVSPHRRVSPLRLDIRCTNAATAVRKGAHHTGLIPFHLPGCCRCHGQFVQVEMGQLDVHNVPRRGVQLLAPGRVERSFRLFDQAVVALITPAREALRVATLGVQVALENAIGVEAITIACDVAVKVTLFQGLTQGHIVKGSERLSEKFPWPAKKHLFAKRYP